MSVDDHVEAGRKYIVSTAIILVLLVIARMSLAETSVSPQNWWVDTVKDIGFPIGVAAFLLARVEKTLAEIRNALIDLKEAIKDKL